MIAVAAPGLLTTVQDEGRPGFRRFGVPASGPLDPVGHALANLLAGNAPGAAALEMTLLGGAFRFGDDAWVGVAGAEMQPTLDGAPVATWSGFRVPAGGVLRFSGAAQGARCYLAVRGGIDVPPFLGSRSTCLRAHVGGHEGRALVAGDALPVARVPGSAVDGAPRRLPGRLVPRLDRELCLRVLLGPQDDRFPADTVATFLASAYSVTDRNDRMGYQLEGPVLRHARGADIVSDALLPGAVQVPASGAPMVMTADCPTVGGYAKIATVIGADLWRLGQARRGDAVRFEPCSMAGAVAALRRERRRLDAAAAALARGGER